MQSCIFSIKLSLRSQKLSRELVETIRTIDGFEEYREADARKPDLLIFELSENSEKEMEMIESLLKANEAGAVFLTAANANPEVLMRAIQVGAKEKK